MTTENGSLDEGAARTDDMDDITASLTSAIEASGSELNGDQGAEPGGDKGADKGTPDVSEAARTLASARKAASDADKGGKPEEGDPAAKRAAELAAMSPEDRAKAEAEDRQRAESEAASVEAPQHWPARDREFFSKQAPEVRQWMLGRHKAMEADYTRRVQEVAHIRREGDELREIFRPFAEAMNADGMTIPMAVRQLTAAHHKLVSDPATGIQWLAQKYGIDLKQIVEGGTQTGQPDPRYQKLESEVTQLRTTLQGQLSERVEQERRANLSKVEQFAEEKDAQGKPLRPYFDDVAKDISMLLRAARDAGETLSLQDAYDRAIYANPTIRQKVLAAVDAERQAKIEDERKRKANAARTAGFDVKGEGAAAPMAAQNDSIEDALAANFRRAQGRV